jgi:hypothetical protein
MVDGKQRNKITTHMMLVDGWLLYMLVYRAMAL